MTWQQWLVLGLTFVLGMFLGAAMMAVALVRRIYTCRRRIMPSWPGSAMTGT
jgi:hypothetical protein